MADLVGFVFQDPEAQFAVDTVEDELAFAMENFALPQSTMRKRVEEVLDQLDIAHLRAAAHQHPVGRGKAARGHRLGAGLAA